MSRSLSGTNLERAGDYNLRTVLQAIRLDQDATRVAIAQQTGLTAPTIANITARLIEASTEVQLWSETYERTLADGLSVQADVVARLAQSLAMELAPDKINVNAILPGPFATEMNLPLTRDPERFAAFVAKIPLGRWGELHEIGGLALYLASPAASYVTGAAFSVDGGWTAQ